MVSRQMAWGFDQFDPGQLGRFLEQGFRGNADARGNGAPQVFPFRRQGTEGGGGTEVDDDQVPFVPVQVMGCHCIDDPVRPDLGGIVVIQFQSRVDLAGHHKGGNAEEPLAHIAQRHQERRNHRGNDDVFNILHIHAAVGKHAAQDDAEFIGSPGPAAGNPPVCLPAFAVVYANYDVGVANIHYH